jgi:hypothetical protein
LAVMNAYSAHLMQVWSWRKGRWKSRKGAACCSTFLKHLLSCSWWLLSKVYR